MSSESPAVAALRQLGRPDVRTHTDYSALGIGRGHIPELIKLAVDEVFWNGEEPEVYGPIHAWRALGQLRAAEATEPLLDVLADNARRDDDWSDWIGEELPQVLGEIGPHVVPAIVARLEQREPFDLAVIDYGNVLVEVAKRNPETGEEVIGHLVRVLDRATENGDEVNGFIISDLIDLKAVETWPAIERAFAGGNVDETIAGDAADVKWDLGLGPEPPRRPLPHFYREAPTGPTVPTGPTAKERHDARKRKEKAEKKKRKQERKRR